MAAVERRLVIPLTVFVVSISLLAFVYHHLPELPAQEKEQIKYPRSIEDAKSLGRVLSRYREKHSTALFGGIALLYVLLQTFAIPGSIFLTILSGYLFPFPFAITLVCTCSACGAAFCYLLSQLVGARLVATHFPERVAKWRAEVARHREHLLNYIIFLRVTPLLPNWFINIASPVLDVPLGPFFVGTFLGVAPPSFLFIQAGTTLEAMTHTNVAWSWSSVALLSFFALLSLAPVFWQKYKASKQLKEEEKKKGVKAE